MNGGTESDAEFVERIRVSVPLGKKLGRGMFFSTAQMELLRGAGVWDDEICFLDNSLMERERDECARSRSAEALRRLRRRHCFDEIASLTPSEQSVVLAKKGIAFETICLLVDRCPKTVRKYLGVAKDYLGSTTPRKRKLIEALASRYQAIVPAQVAFEQARHEYRQSILRAIESGISVRALADHFGVTTTTIRNAMGRAERARRFRSPIEKFFQETPRDLASGLTRIERAPPQFKTRDKYAEHAGTLAGLI